MTDTPDPTPPTYVLVITGVLPPGTDLALATQIVSSAVSVNLPLSTTLRAQFCQVVDDVSPIDLAKRLRDTVEPRVVNAKPRIVQ